MKHLHAFCELVAHNSWAAIIYFLNFLSHVENMPICTIWIRCLCSLLFIGPVLMDMNMKTHKKKCAASQYGHLNTNNSSFLSSWALWVVIGRRFYNTGKIFNWLLIHAVTDQFIISVTWITIECTMILQIGEERGHIYNEINAMHQTSLSVVWNQRYKAKSFSITKQSYEVLCICIS